MLSLSSLSPAHGARSPRCASPFIIALATLAAAALIAVAWWMRPLLGPLYSDRWGMAIFLVLLLWADVVVGVLAPRRLRYAAISVGVGAILAVLTIPLLAGLALVAVVPVVLAALAVTVSLIPWTRKRIGIRRLVLLAGCSVVAGLTCLAPGLCSALFTSATPTTGSVAERLAFVHHTDQTDRRSGAILFDDSRDRDRLQLVRSFAADGARLEGWDAYRAAMILQHGTCPSDFEAATVLFERAAEADVADAGSLARAAHDRWQISLGLPQRYGTQLALNQTATDGAC